MVSIIVTGMAYFLMILLTSIAILLAKIIRLRMALPILTTIAVYFPFLLEIQFSLARGLLLLVAWTGTQSIWIFYLSYRNPSEMARLIWQAEPYTDGMFRWIRSGELPEGSAARVILFHARQALVYCVCAFISGNFLSLFMGSALLNYMNYYVAQLSLRSSNPVQAMWMGWNPWSIVRVIAFLYLGIVFAAPSLSFFLPVGFTLSTAAVLPGVAGLIFDTACKILLAPAWSRRLCALLVSNRVEGSAARGC